MDGRFGFLKKSQSTLIGRCTAQASEKGKKKKEKRIE